MSEKRFRYDSALEKVYDDGTYNGETTESYGVFECCEIMNEQQVTINALKEENEQLRHELDSVGLKMTRFKYVWENISDPAIYDTITGNYYFINDEDDIERIVGLLNTLKQNLYIL